MARPVFLRHLKQGVAAAAMLWALPSGEAFPEGITYGLHFQAEQAFVDGQVRPMTKSTRSDYINVVRANPAITYAPRKDGGLDSFGPNEARITDLGLLREDAATNLALWSEDFTNAVWGIGNVTVTPNASDGPRGPNTMTKLEATTSAFTSLNQQLITATATSHTYSVTVKKGSGATDANTFILRNDTTSVNIVNVIFNYDTGIASASAGSVTVEDLGNNTYKLNLIATSGVSVGDALRIYTCFSGGAKTAGEYAYVDMAQVVSGTTPSSYIPTTTAAVTRDADQITAVKDGNLPFKGFVQGRGTIGVEFTSSVADANRYALSVTDGTSNNIIAIRRPNFFGGVVSALFQKASATQADLPLGDPGDNTTTKATLAYSANDFVASRDGGTLVTDTTGTVATDLNLLTIGGLALSSANNLNGFIRSIVYFDTRLPDKEVQNLSKIQGYWTPGASTYLDFEAGDYVVGNDAFKRLDEIINVVKASPAITYAERLDGTLQAFGPNEARITNKGLLGEGAGTNLALWSEDFTNAVWFVGNATTKGTANAAAAPDGTATADEVVFGTNVLGKIESDVSSSTSVSTQYTFSVYAKVASGTSSFRINIFDTVGGDNLSVDQPVTTEWARFSLTATFSTGTTRLIGLINNAVGNAGTILFWGAQVETGTTPSSYIPTTTAAVTRDADQDTLVPDGSLPFKGFNPSEGTFVVEFMYDSALIANTGMVFQIADSAGASANRIDFRSNNGQVIVSSSGTNVAVMTPGGLVSGQLNKFATAYKNNDFATVTNGGTVITDTTGAVPIGMNKMILGDSIEAGPGTHSLNNSIKSITYFPTRLTDAELQALSTL